MTAALNRRNDDIVAAPDPKWIAVSDAGEAAFRKDSAA